MNRAFLAQMTQRAGDARDCGVSLSRRGVTRSNKGFTLPELMIAAGLATAVVAGALILHTNMQRNFRATALRLEVDHEVNMALNRIVYGAGGRRGVRAANSIQLSHAGSNWTLTYVTSQTQTNSIRYTAAQSNLVFHPGAITLAENVGAAGIAVNPALGLLSITVRVDRVRGGFRSQSQASTTIRTRN